MFLTSVGHLLRTVTFGNHHHRATQRLEQINVGVHTTCGGRAETTRSHTCGGLGRACVIYGVVFEILGHRLALVNHLFDACVSDVTSHNQCTFQVQTGFDRVFGQRSQNFVHTLVEVDIYCGRHCGCLCGQVFRRLFFELLQPDTVGIDFGLDVTVGATTYTNTNGARSGVARHTDYANVVNKVFTAKLCTDTALLADFEHFGLPFEVTESTTTLVTAGRKVIEIACRSLFNGCQVSLGRSTAHNNCQVVGRTSRSAQVFDVFGDEFGQVLLGQQGFGLLVEESFVGRATTFGDEQEFILVAFGGIEVDLSRQVGAAVFLVEHSEGNNLRITQVTLGVGLVNTARDALGIVHTGINILALLADTDCGTGILTGGEFALGSHALVYEHSIGNEFIVIGSLGVVEDIIEFLEMRAAQIERHIGIGLLREQFKTFGVDAENLAVAALLNSDIVFGNQAILGGVLSHFERLLIDKICHN